MVVSICACAPAARSSASAHIRVGIFMGEILASPRPSARAATAPPPLDLGALSGRLPRMQVLAGDIGGTKTLLAICEVSEAADRSGAHRVEVLARSRYESGRFPGLGAVCRKFAEEVGRPLPRFAGFGIAGPVANGRCHTTNLPWIVDERDLTQTLGIDAVKLANDFHALALGIQSV